MTRRGMRVNAGAKLLAPISSWYDADQYFAKHHGRDARAKLAHNMVPHQVEGLPPGSIGYAVRLHGTDIVTFYRDGTLKLDSGGYRTATTKARMNEVLCGTGLSVGQSDFEWFVYERASSHKPIEFFDGMILRVEEDRFTTMRNPPGKFEGSGAIGEAVYELVQDASYLDEELGSSADMGTWYGLVTNLDVPGVRGKVYAIVSESSQGFFDVMRYKTAQDAQHAWTKLAKEYERESAGMA